VTINYLLLYVWWSPITSCFINRKMVTNDCLLQIWWVVKPYMDNYHDKQMRETFVMSPTATYHSSVPAAKKRKRTKHDSN